MQSYILTVKSHILQNNKSHELRASILSISPPPYRILLVVYISISNYKLSIRSDCTLDEKEGRGRAIDK